MGFTLFGRNYSIDLRRLLSSKFFWRLIWVFPSFPERMKGVRQCCQYFPLSFLRFLGFSAFSRNCPRKSLRIGVKRGSLIGRVCTFLPIDSRRQNFSGKPLGPFWAFLKQWRGCANGNIEFLWVFWDFLDIPNLVETAPEKALGIR